MHKKAPHQTLCLIRFLGQSHHFRGLDSFFHFVYFWGQNARFSVKSNFLGFRTPKTQNERFGRFGTKISHRNRYVYKHLEHFSANVILLLFHLYQKKSSAEIRFRKTFCDFWEIHFLHKNDSFKNISFSGKTMIWALFLVQTTKCHFPEFHPRTPILRLLAPKSQNDNNSNFLVQTMSFPAPSRQPL